MEDEQPEEINIYKDASQRFRIIAFHRLFVDWTGSVTAALFLSQLTFWSGRTKSKLGWIYKSIEQWEEETGLKRAQQKGARRILTELELIEEARQGIPARLYFRLGREFMNKPQMADYNYSRPVAGRLAGLPQADSLAYDRPSTSQTTHRKQHSAPDAGIGGEGRVFQACKDFRDMVKKRTGKNYPDHILQKRWITLTTSFVQDQLQGKQDHFLKVLDWYMKNIDGAYITECTSLPGFCEKFRQIEKARSRQAQSNGESDPETHNTVIIRKHNPNLKDTW